MEKEIENEEINKEKMKLDNDVESMKMDDNSYSLPTFGTKSILNVTHFPASLKWQDLEYEIDIKESIPGKKFKKQTRAKKILNGVSGYVNQGKKKKGGSFFNVEEIIKIK